MIKLIFETITLVMKNEPTGREQEWMWEIRAGATAPVQASNDGELNMGEKWRKVNSFEKSLESKINRT